MSILVPVPRIKDMSGYRQLTPQEIEALREDMRQSSEWASDSVVKITQATHILNVMGFESNQQMTRYKFRKTNGIFPVEDK